ncbi:hypothetical protein [Bradymonas sediminis]|nr:hypothetical protein [Bradymonas sediminis]TDP75225.1 hypothetical protein DFR33_10490 [Bradymonas sediminis]
MWMALCVGALLAGAGCEDETHQDRADAAISGGADVDSSADVRRDDTHQTPSDVTNEVDDSDDTSGDTVGDTATDTLSDTGGASSPWTAAEGYEISGAAADRSLIELTRPGGGLGTKPGGGPPRLWDFGTEVYIDGQSSSYNADLEDGAFAMEPELASPLYGTYNSARNPPIFKTTGENMRFDASLGYYFAPGGSPDGEKAGAYFMGVQATGGKTSSPEPFRDGRYYYSYRQVFPEGADDNSLKTMRGSQRDSQHHGWSGSAAGNIAKNQWSYTNADGELVWPPPRENGYMVPVWSSLPSGDIRQWHLQEMLIDPTGDTKPGKIFNTWYLWFADTGRNEWLPAMMKDPDGNEVGRWTPNEYWDETRGFYHQVGPEPAGYDQPDYYFGEVYVDDSWRRLYLADAPTWEETSKVELQRPITWEDERIEFALNLGALHDRSELYLYWVDNANQPTFAGTLALENASD